MSSGRRIDYRPCPAAAEALEIARRFAPHLRTDVALIDWLIIQAACALDQPKPIISGNDRHRWRMPSRVKDVRQAGQSGNRPSPSEEG